MVLTIPDAQKDERSELTTQGSSAILCAKEAYAQCLLLVRCTLVVRFISFQSLQKKSRPCSLAERRFHCTAIETQTRQKYRMKTRRLLKQTANCPLIALSHCGLQLIMKTHKFFFHKIEIFGFKIFLLLFSST